MTILEVWRDAMYEGATRMWPSLAPEQFGDAARTWIARQEGALTLQQVALGVEMELRSRFGPPREEVMPPR